MIEQPLWRVVADRNIFRNNVAVAVTVGADETFAGAVAHRICAAMNHAEALAECDRACPNCHRCMCACDDDDDDDDDEGP